MVKKPDKYILDYKKNLFLQEVGKASSSLGVPTPMVKFWSHYEDHFDADERAHIHVEDNLICIAEPELERMSEEDIRTTATHEVTHIHHLGHGMEFQDTQDTLELGSWEKPAGTVGALPEDYVPPKEEKKRKQRPIKYKCNHCNKKGKTRKCPYCNGYFCEEHIQPKRAGMQKLGASDTTSLLHNMELNKKNAHSCMPYTTKGLATSNLDEDLDYEEEILDNPNDFGKYENEVFAKPISNDLIKSNNSIKIKKKNVKKKIKKKPIKKKPIKKKIKQEQIKEEDIHELSVKRLDEEKWEMKQRMLKEIEEKEKRKERKRQEKIRKRKEFYKKLKGFFKNS